MTAPPITKILESHSSLGIVIEELAGGLSDSHVYKLVGESGSRVLKVQKDSRELRFLTEFSPKLFPNADWLPRIHEHGILDGWNWMLCEFIPGKWPRERFSFDREALKLLRQIHEVEVEADTFDWRDHAWTEKQLEVSARYLPAATNRRLQFIHKLYLERVEQNVSLCSGDANAPNWLIREDGQIVLIDWQMVTRANRALDIAGWIATMLNFQEIIEVARVYLGNADRSDVIELARDIAIFFCRRCATNFWWSEVSSRPELWEAGNIRMAKELPEWLDSMVSEARLS